MMRWDHYKYVFNASSFDELYDLQVDPHELHNLIDEPAMSAVVAAGREHLMEWIGETRDGLEYAARCMIG